MGFCNYRTGTAAELNRELLQLDFETTRGMFSDVNSRAVYKTKNKTLL